eukprot:8900571-Pyramimonas_sp.AAC.1
MCNLALDQGRRSPMKARRPLLRDSARAALLRAGAWGAPHLVSTGKPQTRETLARLLWSQRRPRAT